MAKSKLIIFFILFLFSLGFIFFDKSKPVLLFKNYLSETLRPFEIIFVKTENKFLFWRSAFFGVKNLKESNINLAAENLKLYGKLAKLSQIEEENMALKEKLNLADKNSWNVLLADIIGRDFENNRSFIIDKGMSDGIAIGMPVIIKGEIVIGKISDASYNTSKVRTVIDVQSKIAAVTSVGKVSGLVRGLGSDIVFDLIAKNKKPGEEDLIISSGTDGLWPRGLLIGKIKRVKSEDSQVFNTADIDLLTDFRDFDNVFIIKNFVQK